MNDRKQIRILFRELENKADKLTPGQASFVASTKKYFSKTGQLSEKQMKILSEIMKWIPEGKKRHQEIRNNSKKTVIPWHEREEHQRI